MCAVLFEALCVRDLGYGTSPLKIFPNSGRRPYLARKGEERREERKREKGEGRKEMQAKSMTLLLLLPCYFL